MAAEVGLEAALVIISVDMSPYGKHERGRRGLTNATDQSGHSLGWIKVQLLAIRPRQCRGISTGIGNHAIEGNAHLTGTSSEFGGDERQGFVGI